jgi:hypothetical protein
MSCDIRLLDPVTEKSVVLDQAHNIKGGIDPLPAD